MLQNYFQNRIIQHEIIENAKRYRSKQMHLHRYTSLTNKSKNALPNYQSEIDYGQRASINQGKTDTKTKN